MMSQTQDHSAAGRIMSMKNSNDTIGNGTRDLPVCSAVPQPTPAVTLYQPQQLILYPSEQTYCISRQSLPSLFSSSSYPSPFSLHLLASSVELHFDSRIPPYTLLVTTPFDRVGAITHSLACIPYTLINPLTPNDHFMRRKAPLTSWRCILYIYSTNTRTEYFKHAAHSPFFSIQNAVYFITLPFLVPVLFTF
jgi:hypothetical protein